MVIKPCSRVRSLTNLNSRQPSLVQDNTGEQVLGSPTYKVCQFSPSICINRHCIRISGEQVLHLHSLILNKDLNTALFNIQNI